MKRYVVVSVICIFTVLLFNSILVCSQEVTKVKYDGEEIRLSTSVLIEDEIIMVPVRNIFEALGAKVNWDSSNESIQVTKDNKEIILKINKQLCKAGDKYLMLERPVKLMMSSSIMPLNLLSKVFTVEIEVDAQKSIINIYDKSYGFALKAKSNILVELNSGLVLLEHNSHKRVNAGNVSKVMNLLLIFESLKNEKISLTDQVVVSDNTASMEGAQLFLEVGEQISVENLIKSIMLMGANDSAMAMAEHIEGSEEKFVYKMNKKAEDLGLKNTHFTNITGIDEYNNYTSAYDVAIMARELIKEHKDVIKYSSLQKETILRKPNEKKEIKFDLRNTNSLLQTYEDCFGLLKGFTSKAQHCLVGTANKGSLQLLSVALGATDNKNIIEETKNMLDYGYNKYDIIK